MFFAAHFFVNDFSKSVDGLRKGVIKQEAIQTLLSSKINEQNGVRTTDFADPKKNILKLRVCVTGARYHR